MLLAILLITGKDISKRSILAREPEHFSTLVELSPINGQKLSNNPDEIDEVSYWVHLKSLVFRRQRMRVKSDWIKDTSEKPIEIGTVDYGVLEAEIALHLETGEITYNLPRLPSDDPLNIGRVEGCVMLWSDNSDCWIVQPAQPGILQARLEEARLCSLIAKRGSIAEITVNIDRGQIDDDFQIKDIRTREFVALRDEELSRAREKMIGLVLGQRWTNRTVVAMQRYKLP